MEDIAREEMDQMYSETIKEIEAGKIVKGKVVQILNDVVMIDIGYKSEGQVPISEFIDRDGKLTVKEGDEVEVFLERLDGDLGIIKLSKRRADRIKAWKEIIKAYEKGKPIYGIIESQVKGGFFVNVGGGLRAFLPFSQADIKPIRDPEDLIGRKFAYKVVKIDERKYNIVVSRREFLEEERKRRVEELMKELKVGAIFEGRVKSITNYGAFVDLGGIDGLLHISDISYERIRHPSELLSVGDRVRVMVKELSDDKKRISLSIKALKPDPWEKVEEEFPIGSRVKGRVKRVLDFGAIVFLKPGIEGFIPLSEMTWIKKQIKPSSILSSGDDVEAAVIGIDHERRRVVLSLKQVLPNPWEELDLKEGDVVEGEIRSITDFGLFVEVAEGIEGLVHVSEVSWTERNPDLNSLFKEGDRIKVKILKIDKEGQRISLSIKALEENPWRRFEREYPPGSIVEGTVSRHADFGLFVKLSDDIEGLVHIKEIPKEPGRRFEEVYPVGSSVKAVVQSVDSDRGRIALSIKAVESKEEEQIKKKYTEEGSGTTLGEILREKNPSITSLIKGVQ